MKTRKFLLTALLVAPLFFAMGCSDEDDHNPLSPSNGHRALTDRLQDKLDFWVADSFQVAGAVVGIKFASDGEVWVGTAGKSNIGFDVDTRYDDIYKIGSITKCYVSHLILMMVNDGRIHLDSAATKYLPPNYAAMMPVDPDSVITVRRLLNHTSGLINYNHTPEWNLTYYANPFYQWSRAELLMFATSRLNFKPGTAWEYSNTGYIYLGLMVEHLTGNPLGQELQTRVFNPLGLSSAYFCLTDNPSVLVDGYLDFSGNNKLDAFEVVTGASPTIAWAAGSMIANAQDMIKFLEEMLNPTLFSATVQAERMTKVPMGAIPAMYGLGIVEEGSTADPAHYALGHVGGIEGFTSALFRDGYGNLIVVMVNGSTPVDAFERGDNNVAHHIFWATRDIIASNPPGMPPARTGFATEPGRGYMNGLAPYK